MKIESVRKLVDEFEGEMLRRMEVVGRSCLVFEMEREWMRMDEICEMLEELVKKGEVDKFEGFGERVKLVGVRFGIWKC